VGCICWNPMTKTKQKSLANKQHQKHEQVPKYGFIIQDSSIPHSTLTNPYSLIGLLKSLFNLPNLIFANCQNITMHIIPSVVGRVASHLINFYIRGPV